MKTLMVLMLTVLLMATMALTTATAQDWVHTATLTRHSEGVRSVAFARNRLVSASAHQLNVWYADSFHFLSTQTFISEIFSVSHRKQWWEAACGSDDAQIWLVDTEDAATAGFLSAFEYDGNNRDEYFYSVAYRPDGKRLAAGEDESRIHIFYTDHINGNRRHLRTMRGHTDSVYSVAWSPDVGRWRVGVVMARCGCGIPITVSISQSSEDTRMMSTVWHSVPMGGCWRVSVGVRPSSSCGT